MVEAQFDIDLRNLESSVMAMLGFVNLVLVVAVVQNADRVEIHEDARIEIVRGERALANVTGRGYGKE